VTVGYFRNPAATQAAVHDGWMDSSDLGYLSEGELFITGRQKDIIIKGGRNLYPEEIEEVVGNMPGIRKGCVAAFGIADPQIGTERLVVVAESREQAPEARQRLRAAVVERVVATVGIPPDAVVISDPGAVLKTSSGKVRRSATRDSYVTGQLGGRRSARALWVRLLITNLAARGRRLAARGLGLSYAGYVGVLLLLTLPSLWALALLLPCGRAIDRLARGSCRVLLALAGCPIRVEGLENLRGTGTVALAANHASYLDPVALAAALPAAFRFVAKRELAAAPLIGTVIRKAGHLTVERGHASQSVADAERITAALRSGSSVLVFPEGTFVESPGILPFRLGAFKSAVETGRPVVPIAIRGTREILAADRWLPRPGPVTVAIAAPLSPDGKDWPAMVRLRDRTRAEIAQRTGERLAERAAAIVS